MSIYDYIEDIYIVYLYHDISPIDIYSHSY